MKVAVFGLGYVGCVSATCLAKLGHDVVGIDVNPVKVDCIQRAQPPIIEPGLSDLLQEVTALGRLRATIQAAEAMANTDVILICVGTPSHGNGSLNYEHIEAVISEIGGLLGRAATYPVVIVRSTVLPEVVQELILPLLERRSGRKAGVDFGLCLNPEFLREGSAVADFHAPAFTIIGELDERSGSVAASLYQHINAPLIRTDMGTAAMIKYASNAYHALKIVFANEMGTLCKTMGVDSHSVMQAFCQDDKLNLSPAYLRPGFAFGGSCLPKDLRALLFYARHSDVEVPVLSAIFASNETHLRRALGLIEATGKRRIGVVGLSFKPGTDDLRESPLVTLIETLLGKGFELRIYDEDVSMGRVFGANRQYIDRMIPHITSLMCSSLRELVVESEVLVIGKRASRLEDILAERPDEELVILDLVGMWRQKNAALIGGRYMGMCW